MKPKIAELERLLKRTDEYVPLIIVTELAPLLRLARAAKEYRETEAPDSWFDVCEALNAFDWEE